MKKYIFALLMTLLSWSALAKPIDSFDPEPTQRVMDYTNTLNDSQKASLSSQLESLKGETNTAEGFIVMIDSTDGVPIEEYTNNLFRKWKIGNKETNNGFLLVIAKNDHKYRTEVGYGLEGTLNDGFLGNAMRDSFKPNFKKNDFYKGIYLFITSVKAKIDKESTIKSEIKNESDTSVWSALRNFALLIILPLGFLILYYRKRNKEKEEALIKEMDDRVKHENMMRDKEIQRQRNREAILAGLAAGALVNQETKKTIDSENKTNYSKKKDDAAKDDYSSISSSNSSSYSSSSDSSSSSSSSYDSGGDSGGGGSSGDW